MAHDPDFPTHPIQVSLPAAGSKRPGWLARELQGKTPQEAVYGVLGPWLLASLENGASLLGDGDVLFRGERWPRAAAMAHFALEEFGKCVIIISLVANLVVESDIDWRAYERDITGHTQKFSLANAVTVLDSHWPNGGLTDLTTAVATFGEIAYRNSHRPLRERSLYVDLQNGDTVKPDASITRDDAYGYLGAGFATLGALTKVVEGFASAINSLLESSDKRMEYRRRHSEFITRQREFVRRVKEELPKLMSDLALHNDQ